ncbi:hypothetical protein [Viridibacillus arvi]|uniref:hypothetical protein n=1 Tax=Viridibacillus arvi TaxID=263475 RepID=UPI00187B7774|nr:hypothetical protein [Viridibacillus sp. JNUCC-6]QOV10202.1 hypothetical protein JNUCC6_16640 [Viridibacillus sp. JNUCC-6]
MKISDLRVQYPLWNIALIIILMIFSYGVVRFSDILFPMIRSLIDNDGGVVVARIDMTAIVTIIVGLVLLVPFYSAYFQKLSKHNKQHPNDKISLFSFQPPEYIEEDEMFRQVTQKATKKVYSFYTMAIPLTIVIMLFPLNRYFFIVILCLIFIIQNLLYYKEIRKYIIEI